MDKKILIDKLKAMSASPSCCPELKQAVKNYFVALATEQVAAKKFADNADALKASGAKYCNCLACTLALEILDNQELLFGKTVSGYGMNKRTLIEKLEALRATPSCYPDLKQAVNAYFVALAAEQVAAKNLVAELEEDVVDIDTLIKNVSDTEHMIKFFGAEGAKLFTENAYKLKVAGAKYCNCFACTTALEILENKDVLLA